MLFVLQTHGERTAWLHWHIFVTRGRPAARAAASVLNRSKQATTPVAAGSETSHSPHPGRCRAPRRGPWARVHDWGERERTRGLQRACAMAASRLPELQDWEAIDTLLVPSPHGRCLGRVPVPLPCRFSSMSLVWRRGSLAIDRTSRLHPSRQVGAGKRRGPPQLIRSERDSEREARVGRRAGRHNGQCWN